MNPGVVFVLIQLIRKTTFLEGNKQHFYGINKMEMDFFLYAFGCLSSQSFNDQLDIPK